jgi:hypothetical protein
VILTHQQSLAKVHVIEHDFKTEISNAAVTTRALLACEDPPLDLAFATGEPNQLARLNILIHTKEIIRIVFVFDRDQLLIIIAVSFFHAFFAFVAHQKVHVRPAG